VGVEANGEQGNTGAREQTRYFQQYSTFSSAGISRDKDQARRPVTAEKLYELFWLRTW